MTASCDVLMPPRHDEEVFIAYGEETREMLRDAAWIGSSRVADHLSVICFLCAFWAITRGRENSLLNVPATD